MASETSNVHYFLACILCHLNLYSDDLLLLELLLEAETVLAVTII